MLAKSVWYVNNVPIDMARWISQTAYSSITPASRRRTEYLTSFSPKAQSIIQDHLARTPDAEDVTLAVLEGLNESLDALRAARGSTRVNQDVGLWVAQTLVDLYGASRVWTLRADDGQSVSPRRNTRSTLSSVERYTPHRVRGTIRRGVDRILLDTNVVSNILHQHKDALDVQALRRCAGSHLISLADSALAELARALATRKLAIDLWANRVHLVSSVLDPQLPVGPGGADLAALIGLRPMRGFDFESMRAYYQGVWGYLCSLRSSQDLEKPGFYTDSSGRQFQVKLDASHVDSVFADVGARWASWVQAAGDELSQLRGKGDDLDEEELRRIIRVFLGIDMVDGALDKIDLAVRVIAARTREAAVNGYRPKTTNDALDFDLLLATAMPAVVCTHDRPLLRLAERSGSSEAWRLMEPRTLLDWLAKQGGHSELDPIGIDVAHGREADVDKEAGGSG